MKLRWLLSALIYAPFLLLAMLLAPLLPAFSVVRWGKLDNNNAEGIGPRLPLWLAWFDTPDNSLSGDYGWSHAHPKTTYFDMVRWLWRNPAYGFAWALGCKEGKGFYWDYRKGYLKLRIGWLLSNPQNGKCMFMLSVRL